jgi:basic membrane protein A
MSGRILRRVLQVVGLTAVLSCLSAVGGFAQTGKAPHAALLQSQGANDAGFGAAGYMGLQALKEKGGFETTMVENIPSADSESAARDFANRGWELIFGHGFEFQAPFLRIAAEYPKSFFIVNKGSPTPNTPPNVLIIDVKEHEPAYLLGMLAAKLTKTNKISAIAGFDYGTIIRIMEAYRLGAKSVNPGVEVSINYAGTWTDPTKGKEIALAQIGRGVDVIFAHASLTSLGVIEAARERNVLAIGSVIDQNSVAPKTVVVGSDYDFARMFMSIGDRLKAGSLKGGSVSYGMADGVLDITPLHAAAAELPSDVRANVDKVRQDIKDKKFVVEEIRKKQP